MYAYLLARILRSTDVSHINDCCPRSEIKSVNPVPSHASENVRRVPHTVMQKL